jgi:hypothetical protein
MSGRRVRARGAGARRAECKWTEGATRRWAQAGVYVYVFAGIARVVQSAVEAVERRAALREDFGWCRGAPAISGVGGWHLLRASAFEKRPTPPIRPPPPPNVV